ncbi:hypothetical protein CTKA_01009 [Chthonomonas calidirosea]|uniref:Uncharacterized protein n=1 Tax=Chthonomonas calidirosea (strain DSM 23976 / ICMP 18418 / T49) TaxID=1303518 RepID=S0EUH9_CHTCT|nr:DUF6785 family protein [Chthonomonas calidirosea]CCW33987.1 hypothetical protein CCALI_00149 [Chthonomonas calidirosea T49]CEK16087.1 hypothetical protein CTKA_01009 [Chthonomonas calidirosea]
MANFSKTADSLETTLSEGRPQGRGWISLRVTLLALLLAPLTAYWTADQVVDVIFSLMIPPVIMTFVVAIINLGVRKISRRWALTEGELIIFYGMHTVLGAICAEWMNIVNPHIATYALYASSNSDYRNKILPYITTWLFVPYQDADKFKDYRDGGHGFHYFLTHLHLWWSYVLGWTLIVGLVGFAMLCINSLMRDEWTNREKLAFPIIQLPLAVVQMGAGRLPLWKNRYFTGAFLIMFAIDIINGFHQFYPNLPLINVRFIGDLQQLFPNPPFNAIGWTPIGIFPYMAVIGFFMPTDLLFSCIFFFFFRKALQVFTYAIGYTQSAGVFGGGGLVPSPPYFSEQSWGAFIGLFVMAIWVARGYLREVWQQILHGHPPGDRGVPHRVAFAGLVLSVVALCVIGVDIGIPLWMTFVTIVLFLIFSVALTRMRAQVGPPSHEMAFMGPNQMIVDFAGTQNLPEAGVSRMVNTFFFLNRIHRTHPMPHQLEAMKMGERARINQRALFIAILLAMVVGSILGHLIYIYRGYVWGAGDVGGDVSGTVSSFTTKHQPPNIVAILFVLIGFCVVLLLDFIRFQVPGFPFHPVGYALAMNFGLDYFWFGLLIVYLIKLFVEKYYGLKGHDKLHQVALGIILAEFCAETIWAVYSMTHNHFATYSVSINGRLGWNQ